MLAMRIITIVTSGKEYFCSKGGLRNTHKIISLGTTQLFHL